MWLAAAAFVVGLSLHGSGGFNRSVDGSLGIVCDLLPTALCWAVAAKAGARQYEVGFLAAGVTAWAGGDVIFRAAAMRHMDLGFPSVADAGYLAFYPLVLAALALAVRRQLRGVQASIWLDSVLVAVAAACAIGVLLDPVLARTEGSLPAKIISTSYPVFDMLLIAAAVGVLALRGWRLRTTWLWPIAGLGIFAIGDIVYALRVAHNAYHLGTVLDAFWAVGLACLASWVRSSGAGEPAPKAETALAVPVLATLLAVLVLCAGTQIHLPMISVVLAALTVVMAAGRTQYAFRQLRRLADLRRQATTDDLTGLPNRRALYQDVTASLAADTEPRALLLLDLDRFKEVNDSLGHHVGDLLLTQVSERLSGQLRAGDLLARLGGDEFAIVLEKADESAALATSRRLHDALAAAFTFEDISLHTSVSIGIALFPDHGSDISTLLRRADVAMYKAKSARDGHCVYRTSDDSRGHERLRTLQQLRTAMTEDQLILHFQPKIDVRTGEIHSVEALVRWEHPTRGLLYPGSFLEMVEDSGLMHALTRRVLVKALDQACSWQTQGTPLGVAVNIPAASLLDGEFPGFVAGQLALRRLPPQTLQLEITEETLMGDRGRARDVLMTLRELGVQIAVDDFGTGYSSLAYLRELPIDELKLDRAFVFPMADDARAAALVESTINLAHSLGLRMVAEGVEDKPTYNELSRFGCDQIQGFYISRPVPAAELDHWMSQRVVQVSEVSHGTGA
jgi:diguanylate cyclase (GGDEF)-like protein